MGNQTDLFYHIKLARKPMYYLLNIVVPCFSITTLSILGLFTPFNAAGERQEKVRVLPCTKALKSRCNKRGSAIVRRFALCR